MSENSGNGSFGRPHLPGYLMEWDDHARQWVATWEKDSHYVLRGVNQAELEQARNRLVVDLADELRGILHDAPGRGYSPPPRT